MKFVFNQPNLIKKQNIENFNYVKFAFEIIIANCFDKMSHSLTFRLKRDRISLLVNLFAIRFTFLLRKKFFLSFYLKP